MNFRASSLFDTHVAQFVGIELGEEPVSAGEGEQGKADQDCKDDEHGVLLSGNSVTSFEQKGCSPFGTVMGLTYKSERMGI